MLVLADRQVTKTTSSTSLSPSPSVGPQQQGTTSAWPAIRLVSRERAMCGLVALLQGGCMYVCNGGRRIWRSRPLISEPRAAEQQRDGCSVSGIAIECCV